MPYKNKSTELPNFRAVCAKYPNHSLPRNHPENWPDGPWEWVDPEPVQLTPEQVLSVKQSEIRMSANEAYTQPVLGPNATKWNGGFDSAIAIKSVVDMAEFAGLSTVSIFDNSNIEHVLSLTEAKIVASTIGIDYQKKFAAKQKAMRDLAAIDLDVEDARELIAAVTIEI